MNVIGLKNCDTCRKAVRALEAKGHNVTFIDVRADGLPQADLERFFAEFSDALLNTRSTTWRSLDEQARRAAPLELLKAHPALMKRPVIEHEGALTLGWTKDVQATYGL